MKLVSPTGAVVDAAAGTAEQLIAHGFRPAEKPQTEKAADKAEPKPKPKKAAKKG